MRYFEKIYPAFDSLLGNFIARELAQQFRIAFAAVPIGRNLDEGHENALIYEALFGHGGEP